MLLRPPTLIASLLLLSVALAGCHDVLPCRPDSEAVPGWDAPDLSGTELTILDHGAFGAFDDAKESFEAATCATVVNVEGDDAGSALNRAIQEKGDPTFDILYGIDNVLFAKALDEGVFAPYTPKAADTVDKRYVFFDTEGDWPATPVDHGYVAVNVDRTSDEVNASDLNNLDELRPVADRFVTQDPRTSSPGLGFLIATVATYGDDDAYDYLDYWNDLFEGGVLITSGWTEAYEQHFSGGYGASFGQADKPIVNSYTTSPAYEAYFGTNVSDVAKVITAPQSTFHQIETMGIVDGTPNRAAAEAWIDFTLTPTFQELLAPSMAVYPTVKGVSADSTFGDVDPTPGSFQPADLGYEQIGNNVERWVQEWTALCERYSCA